MDNDNLKEFESVKVEATSMDIEESTLSYIKLENESQLDEQKIYMDESKDHLRTLLEYQIICELCKQMCTHKFTPVKHLESDLTSNLNTPEMKYSSISGPVVCSSCLDSLKTERRSIKNNSDVEGEFSNTSNEKEGPFQIKTEEIEIKSEEDEDGTVFGCDDEPCESQACQNQPTREDSSTAQKYRCKKCAFETKYKHNLERHELTHERISNIQTYKCDKCDYESKYKQHLKQHLLTHGAKIYRCDACNFGTKYELALDRHQLKHKVNFVAQMYTCDRCNFKATYKGSIRRHHLRMHINSSQP